jgi:hypothetical protein
MTVDCNYNVGDKLPQRISCTPCPVKARKIKDKTEEDDPLSIEAPRDKCTIQSHHKPVRD